MDSSNSGSIQSSSSGGDDDYDSRTEAISSFLNLPPPPPPPPPPSSHHLHQHPSPSSFISLSPYLNAFPSTPPDPYPLSLDIPWAKSSLPSSTLSDPGCTILGGLTTATTSSSSSSSSSSKTMAVGAPFHGPHSSNTSLNPSSVQLPTQPTQPAAATPRGSKKRSRASRRAPTTVLTTDTSNFRAMVQEFTGFPAAPFMSSSFSRPRLDLFPATAAAAPPYLLRPFAQKGQAPFFSPFSSTTSSSSSSSSSVAAFIARTSVSNANAGAPSAACSNSSSSSTATSSNYQLPSIGLRHPNLLNIQSPNFTFQSPLQPLTGPDHNSSTMPAVGGSSDFAAGGLGSLITLEAGTKPISGSRDDGFPGWAGGSASEGRDRSQLRSVIGNYGTLQLVSSHAAEKEPESMGAARGEGRVDSWILSSD